MGLTLAKALRLSSPCCVAFVGAGGKTTAMSQLAKELAPPVIVTATTHLGGWQTSLADQHLITERADDFANQNWHGVTLVTGPSLDERTKPVSGNVLSWLRAETQKAGLSLLIEADGARQKPLKAPAEHEPPIPDFTDVVVVVAGLSALGQPLAEEFVHRSERFSRLSGLKMGEKISSDVIARVLTHPEGGLKNIPKNARRVALLNQADTPESQSQARGIIRSLLSAFDAVIVASLKEKIIYAVHEHVAGIILAAGESKRFGTPKQLLDWHGEPFIRVIAKTALNAKLSPVVVVTGSNAEQVEAAIKDLPVKIVRNNEWQGGQATSIRAGLIPLSQIGRGARGEGAVIFLLSDQPQVTVTVIQALAETHAAELHPIVAPLVMMEQRANPVLFDRVTFPDLLALEGDVGGRAIFSKHHVEYMPWHDENLLLDVDKPEDYHRMKGLE